MTTISFQIDASPQVYSVKCIYVFADADDKYIYYSNNNAAKNIRHAAAAALGTDRQTPQPAELTIDTCTYVGPLLQSYPSAYPSKSLTNHHHHHHHNCIPKNKSSSFFFHCIYIYIRNTVQTKEY